MLDYREIIRDRYDLHMSGREIARALGISKSGVNSFLKAFEASANIHYPLPEAVTNAEIQERVYGPLEERMLAYSSRFASPDFGKDESTSLAEQWRSYRSRCLVSGRQFYSYRQYCAKYAAWKKEQDKVISPVSRTAPTIEIGLMDQTFELVNRRTGEITEITVAAAVLSGCGLIYAEGLCSDEGSVWIDFLNRMIRNFGGISSVICIQDSRQAEHAGKKRKTAWEKDAELSEWAKHKHTEMRPLLEPEEDFAKAQCALEEMVFPDLERETFFSLSDFNAALSESLERRNNRKFSNRNYSPHDLWIKKKGMLQILPDELYLYTERKNVKVSGDYHIKFDEAYYSVPFPAPHCASGPEHSTEASGRQIRSTCQAEILIPMAGTEIISGEKPPLLVRIQKKQSSKSFIANNTKHRPIDTAYGFSALQKALAAEIWKSPVERQF